MNLLVCDSDASWVENIATLWRDRLRENPRLRMCLASGNTPNPVYAAMVKAFARGAASFRNAEVFALDDFGGLALDDPGRCANMLRRYLVDHVDLPKDQFHIIDTTAPDLDGICRSYDTAIGAGFDLSVLGIGLNGHLGLNEPGSSPDSTTRRVDLHATTISASAGYLTHQNLPTWGVGVGLKHLLGSKEVWLLATGAKKAEIVHRMLAGPVGVDLPASLLRNHPNSWLMLDSAAATLLQRFA